MKNARDVRAGECILYVAVLTYERSSRTHTVRFLAHTFRSTEENTDGKPKKKHQEI